MRLLATVAGISLSAALLPIWSARQQPDIPAQPAAVQPLSQRLVGNWTGVLIFNDRRRNFTRVPARLRFTGSVLYMDREEIELPFLSFPALRDWRADYEVVGSAVYLNPQRAGAPTPAPIVIGDLTVADNRVEGVARGTFPLPGDPFGYYGFPTAFRMQRQ